VDNKVNWYDERCMETVEVHQDSMTIVHSESQIGSGGDKGRCVRACIISGC